MLDIKLIRERTDLVENDLKKRNEPEKLKVLRQLIEKDMERRILIKEVEEFRRKRNEITELISKKKLEGEDVENLLEEAKKIPAAVKEKESRLEDLNHLCRELLMRLPNMLHPAVPIGKDENDNREVRRWGEREFDFEPKSHLEIAENLGLIDTERAAKTAGHGFYYLKKELVVLDYAIIRFALDFLADKGFTLIEPPFMLRREPYEGVVDLKDFENMLYKIDNEDLYLIATSEHPMAAMYMDEVLNKDDLPIKLAGASPCFRKELGAHGKYTKGIFRVHHFNKVEQFVFCLPNESWQIHEELQHNSEQLCQELGIPYRVVDICSGEIGSIAARKYDIEFLMADGVYREIGSNSNCTDYQASSLNIRYREKEGLPTAGFVHTLNNTALATSRVMIAILENFQRADGSVDMPKVLWPYTGFKRLE